MIIQLSKCKRTYWKANIRDLPGTPPIGEGTTAIDAVISLFFRILADQVVDWRQYIDFGSYRIENVERDAF